MSVKTKAMLAVVLSAIIGGSVGSVMKILLQNLTPIQIGFGRFLIASIVLAPFFFSQKDLNLKYILRRVVPITLFAVGNVLLFFYGINLTTANASSIIYSSTPITIGILAHFLISEKLTFNKLTALTIGFVGVLTITIMPLYLRGDINAGNLTGNLLIVAATINWALYTITSRHLLSQKRTTSLSLTTILVILNFFTFVMFGFNQEVSAARVLDLKIGSLLLYYGIIATVVMVFLYQWALNHLSAVAVSMNFYLQLISAVGLNYLILGERLTWAHLLGTFLILVGVYKMSKANIKPVLGELKNLFMVKSRN